MSQYKAGYGRVIITPDYPASLGGYGNYNNRVYEKIMDDLTLTCIAVSQGEQTVLAFTCDNLFWIVEMSQATRPLVAKATGVPEENIFFSAIHTHGAPMLFLGTDTSNRYRAQLQDWAVEAAKMAVNDLAEAQIYTGSRQIENMNFVRHYKLADGNYMGSNFNENSTSPIVEHAAQPDKQMTVIKFARCGEKKDILLVNWQAHADSTGENGYRVLTADFPGDVRRTLEAQTGMEVAYFAGAGGNLVKNSKIPELAHQLTRAQYGEKLAEHAMSILEEAKPMTEGGIRVARKVVTVNVNHSWDHMLPQANEIYDLMERKGEKVATEAGKAYGFSSAYQAGSIINRAGWDATDTMELNVFSIGNIGFVNGTYEMFSESAVFIKEHSPFDTTFIMEGNHVYLPSRAAYQYRCYESDTAYYEEGTAEMLADTFVEMLQELK